MLIDAYLPRCDVAERHETTVRAPAERVYAAVRELDLSGSLAIRLLFGLRSLPALFARRRRAAGLGVSLESLLRSGFVLLAERPGEELVLGLVGRFWTPGGGILRLDAAGFRAFDRPGYARAVWNFHVSGAEGAVRLGTETRVLCTDGASRRRFRAYWLLIGPFSGLIRRLALRQIRRAAEAGGDSTAAKQIPQPRVS